MTQAIDTPQTLGQRFKKRRRKTVKKLGRKLTRNLADFLGRRSLVGDTPILDNALFPSLAPFTAHWREIEAEARGVLKFRDAIPGFQEVSPDQYRLATEKNWRTFVLYGFGKRLDKNCVHAPFTADLLSKVPHIQTAWFSILAPRYHIPPHRGVTKGIVRAHLGLIIPNDAENCWIRVDDQIKAWHPGEVFVFDDTYEHEVYNNTDEERVILLFDFDRPMSFMGRAVSKSFLSLMKLTAFYQEPKKNLANFEDRFEAATRRNNENFEKLSDDG